MTRKNALMLLMPLCAFGAALMLKSQESAASRAHTGALVDAIPMRAGDLMSLETQLRSPGVRELATLSVRSAAERAHDVALSQSSERAMAHARQDLTLGRHLHAERLLRALLDRLSAQAPDAPGRQAHLSQAQLLLARVLLLADQPHEALAMLDATPADTPVEDYRLWMRAQALSALRRHAQAASTYARLAQLPHSPMAHRARVQRAHALFMARDHAQAAQALTQVNALYPDYPRRYIALFELAQSLELLGRLDEAASTYQQVWFEYPFRAQGHMAQARRDALVAQGARVPALSLEERLKRTRTLRINKHWDTARQLFLELLHEVTLERGPHDAMRHELLMQLGLNAIIPKEYDEALGYFQAVVTAYEDNHRDGIDPEQAYTSYARALAKVGRLPEALKALDKAHARQPPQTRDRLRAELLIEHARYRDALALLEPLSPPSAKPSWSMTWLRYKAGQLKEAREGFEALASRASGSTRAKYQYWAARAAERAGLQREAAQGFEQVLATSRTSYYGIQAANRLLDLRRRRALRNDQLLVSTARVARAADAALDAMAAAPSTSPRQALSTLAMTPDRLAQRDPDQPASPLGALLDAPACLPEPSTLLCQIAAQLPAAPITSGHRRQDDAASSSLDPATRPPTRATWDIAPQAPQGPPMTPSPADPDEPRPRAVYTSKDNARDALPWTTEARLYWDGDDASEVQFARYERGLAPGPFPSSMTAYGDEHPEGAVHLAADKLGVLFPELVRASWLKHLGMNKEARWAIREVSLELRALAKLPRPRVAPHALPFKRMTPLIDNRRSPKATWGYVERELRWPIPQDPKAQRAMLARQQEIIDRKRELTPLLMDAFKDVGDYYMVRRLTMELGWAPSARARQLQLHPRAFPDLVLPAAQRYGVNPYILWALMTVESSYNPDSVSVAEALGLLQVIPRTGLKIADLLQDDRFGHYDLLDEDVAIEHGAFYIAQVIKKFYGQELFAFAGYNGGPHRVAEWLDQRADMPLDEFVEEIPFDQAREYTKKVTYFLALYLRLYEGKDTLYIGQNIQRDYRRMPNF